MPGKRVKSETRRKDEIMDLHVGDIVKMKKPHPCGSKEWELLRVGMDFKMKCQGCGHMVMVPRLQAEKNIRGVTPFNEAQKKDF